MSIQVFSCSLYHSSCCWYTSAGLNRPDWSSWELGIFWDQKKLCYLQPPKNCEVVIKKLELSVELRTNWPLVQSTPTMNLKKVRIFRIFPIDRGGRNLGQSFAELNGEILSKVLQLHFYQHLTYTVVLHQSIIWNIYLLDNKNLFIPHCFFVIFVLHRLPELQNVTDWLDVKILELCGEIFESIICTSEFRCWVNIY